MDYSGLVPNLFNGLRGASREIANPFAHPHLPS